MVHIRVLISDNCADYANLLSDCLSTQPGVEIVGIALDGNQTIDMMQSKTPDVLLLDLIMPNMDGLEVLRQMNISGESPAVFVISAVRNEEIMKLAFALGARYYFVKPFEFASVAFKIREMQCN